MIANNGGDDSRDEQKRAGVSCVHQIFCRLCFVLIREADTPESLTEQEQNTSERHSLVCRTVLQAACGWRRYQAHVTTRC